MTEMDRGKKKHLRFVSVFLVLTLCLAATASPVAAAKQVIFSAREAAEATEQVVSRKNQNGWYILSIPGTWDITRIRLSLEGEDSFQLGKDGPVVDAQTPVDLTPYLGAKTPVYNLKRRTLGNLVIYHGSDIPALFFTVDAKQLKNVNRSKKEVITEGQVTVQEADGSVSYQGEITQLKGRGNNTFSYLKKPYEFKLPRKADLCGMGKGKTWILLANYLDVSLLRNQIVLDLSRETGLPYALDCRQVDVWLNCVYNGVYLMTEKVQISKNRVDITDLEEKTEEVNDQPLDTYPKFDLEKGFLPIMRGYKIPNDPEDITGGYIATIEKRHRLTDNRKPGIRTKKQLSVRIKEPTCPSEAQVNYLGKLLNDMHYAILAEDGMNADTGMHYSEYLDMTSFAKKFLIEEVSKNYDAVSGSQFFFKDSDRVDPLIYAGPSWDYDLSFGNMTARGTSAEGDYLLKVEVEPINLYMQLGQHEDFMELVGTNWREVFRPAMAVLMGEAPAPESGCIRSIDEYYAMLKDSAKMNQVRWGTGTKVNPKSGKDFDSGVEALKNWIRKRMDYLDGRYAR